MKSTHLYALIGIVVSLFLSPETFSNVRPFSENEIIAASQTIFSGKVIEAKARKNPQGNLIVTDYTFEVDKTLWGKLPKKVTLTFPGGKLGEEVVVLSEVPMFEVGQQVLLMVEDMKKPLLSPTVGGLQGVFTGAVLDTEEGVQMGALNGDVVTLNAEGNITPFSEFVDTMAEKVQKVKQDTTFVQQLLSDIHIQPTASVSQNSKRHEAARRKECADDYVVRIAGGGEEKDSVASAGAIVEPLMPPSLKSDENPIIVMESKQELVPMSIMDSILNGLRGFKYPMKFRLPITFIPLSKDDAVFQGADEDAMGYWNTFLKPGAKIMVKRDKELQKTWGYGNGCNDIAGFVDEKTFYDLTGYHYGSGGGFSAITTLWQNLFNIYKKGLEIDIIFNPGSTHTAEIQAYLKEDYRYRRGNFAERLGFDHTIIHEVGHALTGHVHLFYDPAVMNYLDFGREAHSLFAKDIRMLWENYGGKAAPYFNHAVNDVGIRTFSTAGKYKKKTDTAGIINANEVHGHPRHHFKRGDVVEVSGFFIENLTPHKMKYMGGIELYLCSKWGERDTCQLVEKAYEGKGKWIDIEPFDEKVFYAAFKIPGKLKNFKKPSYYSLFVYLGRGDDFPWNNGAWLPATHEISIE